MSFPKRLRHWEQFIERQIQYCVQQHQSTQLPQHLLQQITTYMHPLRGSLKEIKKCVLLTGEYTPMNFLVKQVDNFWHIYGLIDFGDAMLGIPEYDLLGPAAFLVQGDQQLLKEFLIAYGYIENELTPALSHRLMALMLLHQYSNLRVQIRIADWQNKVSCLQELEKLIWCF